MNIISKSPIAKCSLVSSLKRGFSSVIKPKLEHRIAQRKKVFDHVKKEYSNVILESVTVG